MTSITVKRRCHLGQVDTNFPQKGWKYIIQSSGLLSSSLQENHCIAVHTFHSLAMLIIGI